MTLAASFRAVEDDSWAGYRPEKVRERSFRNRTSAPDGIVDALTDQDVDGRKNSRKSGLR
jgi:hypothetical protein